MELTLKLLKEVAIKLDFNHSPNIGYETLKSKLEAHAIELGTTLEEVAESIFLSELNILEKNEKQVEASTEEIAKQEEITRLSKMGFVDIETDNAKKSEATQIKEAMKLKRVLITCNNKNKTSYPGEIFCSRNAVLEEVKKYVPFGVPTHVPQILYNVIKEKQCQMFMKRKENGIQTTKAFLVPEYNIQDLPPLTREEFEAIRQKQLAEGYGTSE